MANLCIKTPSSASLVLIFPLLVLRPRPTVQFFHQKREWRHIFEQVKVLLPKLSPKWVNLKDSVCSGMISKTMSLALLGLRDDKDFTDVTLLCEDASNLKLTGLFWSRRVHSLITYWREANIPILSFTWEVWTQGIFHQFWTFFISERQRFARKTLTIS